MIEKSNNTFQKRPERCVLIGLVHRNLSRWDVEDHLRELKALAQTGNAIVEESFIQDRNAPDAAYFIGRGKLEEINNFVEMNDIELVIFDDELSPAQVKNIGNIIKCKIIDRAALILDIFADHARSNEAKVQVELAQLNYLLPRLTRQWQHLSRQVGGIGTKGPGETQLETDRRLVRTRISHLKKQLKKISKQLETQKQQRKNLFRAAIIGYTNAGKSTLINNLTGDNLLAENKLFATLDTTVRRLDLDGNNEILISDTVGFIRKLPHHLVASFRTTLSEAMEADLLINVVDASHPHFEEHIRVVNQILEDLGAKEKPLLLLFNKVDLVKEKALLDGIKLQFPQAFFISARKGMGNQAVLTKLRQIMQSDYKTIKLRIPYSAGPVQHKLHQLGTVLESKPQDDAEAITLKYAVDKEGMIKKLVGQFMERD